MQQGIAHVDQARADGDHVIVAGRGLVAAAHVHDGDVCAVLLFHCAVGEAHLAQHLYPPHLKPDDKVGVIDHTHLVGLRIAHPQLGLVHLNFRACTSRLPVFSFQPGTHSAGDTTTHEIGRRDDSTWIASEALFFRRRWRVAGSRSVADHLPSYHLTYRHWLAVCDVVNELRRQRLDGGEPDRILQLVVYFGSDRIARVTALSHRITLLDHVVMFPLNAVLLEVRQQRVFVVVVRDQ